MGLLVKRVLEEAKKPEVAHYGEDLAYDVFSAETVVIEPGEQKRVRTGWSMQHTHKTFDQVNYIPVGLIAKQPSGVALKRSLAVHAGVIDAGFRGEVTILLYNYGDTTQYIYPKEKIAQLMPVLTLTADVVEVSDLSESSRGSNGWGSNHKG